MSSIRKAAAAAMFLLLGNAAIVNAQVTDVTAPGNTIYGVERTMAGQNSTLSTVGSDASDSGYPTNESPDKLIDNNPGTKYLNFAINNTGVIVTTGLSKVNSFQLTSANDTPARDPASFTLEGTTVSNPQTAPGSAWTLIASGSDDPGAGFFVDPGRGRPGTLISFANENSYSSYRLLFPSVYGPGANSMQVAELSLNGTFTPVPEPGALTIAGIGAATLLTRRRRR